MIDIAKRSVNHVETKHIDVRLFAIRDWVTEWKFRSDYLPTHDMLEDALTKPLCASACYAKVWIWCLIGTPQVSRSRISVAATKRSAMH